jgi:hypothetical protein
MTDDERAHTRNWMCAFSNVMEDSMACNGGTIRIDYPKGGTGLVVGGRRCLQAPAPRLAVGWTRADKAYSQGLKDVRERGNKQPYRARMDEGKKQYAPGRGP